MTISDFPISGGTVSDQQRRMVFATYNVSVSFGIGTTAVFSGGGNIVASVSFGIGLAQGDDSVRQQLAALTLATILDAVFNASIPGPPAAAFRNAALSLPSFSTQALTQPSFANPSIAVGSFSHETLES